ncbi:MAG: hypothetical protein KF831_03255 [Acidobacteria bacterium]|nr:hypothetical protein [Acidobacteriota bacterium]
MSKGDNNLLLDKYDEALESYSLAKEKAREAQYVEGSVRAERYCAKTLLRMGKTDSAIPRLDQSISDCEADSECREFEFIVSATYLISILLDTSRIEAASPMKDNRVTEIVRRIIAAAPDFERSDEVRNSIDNSIRRLRDNGYEEEAQRLERLSRTLF